MHVRIYVEACGAALAPRPARAGLSSSRRHLHIPGCTLPGVCYTEKATEARHRLERQCSACANRKKQCIPGSTLPGVSGSMVPRPTITEAILNKLPLSGIAYALHAILALRSQLTVRALRGDSNRGLAQPRKEQAQQKQQ